MKSFGEGVAWRVRWSGNRLTRHVLNVGILIQIYIYISYILNKNCKHLRAKIPSALPLRFGANSKPLPRKIMSAGNSLPRTKLAVSAVMYHVFPGLCDAVLCLACRALLELSGLLRLTWRSRVHRVTKVCWVLSVIQQLDKAIGHKRREDERGWEMCKNVQKAHKARALLNWRWRLQPQFLLTNYTKNPSPQLMWKPRCRCCDFWRASGSRVPMGGVNLLDSDSTAKGGKRHLGFGPPVSDFDLKVMLVHLFGSLCSSFEFHML